MGRKVLHPYCNLQVYFIGSHRHTNLSDSKFHMVTVLSKDPLASRLPSQLQATE